MIIDAHHHLWRLDRGDYDWLKPDLTVLYRDFGPGDLAPLMKAGGVAGSIVVQAAPTGAETDYLLALAERTPTILGVIGWTDFTAPDTTDVIAKRSKNPKLKGFRPMLQDLPDDDFILRPSAAAALDAICRNGSRFEALVRPRHLPRLVALRERHPDLAMVIDHAAKPDIANGAWEPWASDLQALARDGKTYCKFSGLITEAGSHWTVDKLRRYVDLILEAFGPRRVIWGSDWPVVLLAGRYDRWLDATHALLGDLPQSDRNAILGGNAADFYNLEIPGLEQS
ncbi:MAG TPA: amidohydrolase family protein [Rhizomicrobium sp.]|nr:amidohydrolase family protein [Rhizomicrobium sp.]